MARRRRSPARAQRLSPPSAESTLPDPLTKCVSNVENANLNDTSSDEIFQGVRYPTHGKLESTETIYRRSKRINSPLEPVRDAQPAAVDLDAVETFNPVELPSNMENHPPEETNNVPEKPAEREKSPEEVGMNYKKMYIDSHKKVKTLTKQNRMLRKKLERALGKIEAYAELTPTLSSISKANQILSKRPWTKTKGLSPYRFG